MLICVCSGIGASVGCAEVGGVCEGTGRGGEDEEMNGDTYLREMKG